MLFVSFIEAKKPSIDDIERVVFDPWVYDRISHDRSPPKKDVIEQLRKGFSGVEYIGGYVNGCIASLYVVHDGLAHFMVLRTFHKFAHGLLDESRRVFPEKVYALIPVCHRSLINFVKKHGFVEAETRKNDFIKNGVAYDRVKLVEE